jgi:hypothetical protein
MAGWLFPASVWATAEALRITTESHVGEDGNVRITLNLHNTSTHSLHHVHPLFHFHHTMAHMPMIHELKPGEGVTLTNDQHPRLVRVGSYPIVAMVHYKTARESDVTRTQVHTGSFYYEEPLKAAIEGDIRARHEQDSDQSTLQIALRNNSPSFKNVRLMLLLPPELSAKSFQGMIGFTIHSGEEKHFVVPVTKVAGRPGGEYPVHLLVEYGEMLKHYSGDIAGSIHFGPDWGKEPLWPQLMVFLFLLITLTAALIRHRRHLLKFS